MDSSTQPFFFFYHGGIDDGVPTLYQTEAYHESEMFGVEGESGLVCPRQRFTDQGDGTYLYTFELSTDQGETWGLQDALLFRPRS